MPREARRKPQRQPPATPGSDGTEVPVGDSSAVLLTRYREGDERAAEDLFQRYVTRLVQLARKQLPPRMARRLDPEDAVQSAYRSFFRRARDGAFQLARSGDLWRLLAAITINKVRRQARQQRAGKRRIDQEASSDGVVDFPAEVVATEPTPAEAAILIEELANVLRAMSPLHRRILELRAQGLCISETADSASCTERTVYRAEARYESLLRDRLRQQRTDT
jgi:RNA polymerase sigma-70 factor (ECF subfamily)